MILVIRGHIRNSFETLDLYNFIEILYNTFSDLKIFIHTWSIFSNGISWKKIDINNTNVTEETIYNYFGEFRKCIKHIIIDDDQNIQLCGNLVGTINNGPMPIIGWKNYWYGKYKIIDYIYNNFKCDDEMIVNTRFDLLNNSNSIFNNKTYVLNFVKKNKQVVSFTKNTFLFRNETNGIDNIYIGNIETMYKLIKKFNFELDDILSKNNDTINQEKLVFRINSILFE